MRRTLWLLLIATLQFGVGACKRQSGTPVLGQILLESKPSGAEEKRVLGVRFVRPGHHITSADGGTTIVRLTPGILISLADGADLVLGDARLRKDGNDTAEEVEFRWARVRLLRGAVYVALAPASSDIVFELDTPAGLISATADSLFVAKVSADSVRVTNVRGTIEMRAKQTGILVQVDAGHFCEWSPGDSSREMQAKPAASDTRAQEEIAQSLEVEALMQRLSAGERNTSRVWLPAPSSSRDGLARD